MIKQLIDYFKSKRVNEDLEDNLAGAPTDYSNPDGLAVAEEANTDEVITVVAKASNEM